MRTGRRARQAGALLLIGLGLGGCGMALPAVPNGLTSKLPPGRVLVVARTGSEDNRSTAEMTADMLLHSLRVCGDTLSARELQAAARPLGLAGWASGLAERLQSAGWPTPEEDRLLGQRFGITTVVAAELIAYEQVWGKYAKFTRTGIEARAYDTGSSRPLWRLRGSAEVEDMAGRAFQAATEQAVQELGDTICPKHTFTITDVWRSWRR
jgi:hypothetical protein